MIFLQKLRRHKASEESSESTNNGRHRSSRRTRRSLRNEEPFSALSPTNAHLHYSESGPTPLRADESTPTALLDSLLAATTPTAMSAPCPTTPLCAVETAPDSIKRRRQRPTALTPNARSTRARSAGRARGHSRSTSWVAPQDMERALADLQTMPLSLKQIPSLALRHAGTSGAEHPYRTPPSPPPLGTELSPSEGVLSNASDSEATGRVPHRVHQKENLLELQLAQQRIATAAQSSASTFLTALGQTPSDRSQQWTPSTTPNAHSVSDPFSRHNVADEGRPSRSAADCPSVSLSVVTVVPLPELVDAAAIVAKNAALPTFDEPPRSENKSKSGSWADVPLVSPEAVDDNDDDPFSDQREGSTHWQLPSETPGAWTETTQPGVGPAHALMRDRVATGSPLDDDSRGYSPPLERKHDASDGGARAPVSPRSLRSSMKHLRSKTVIIRDESSRHSHSRSHSRGAHSRQRSDTDFRAAADPTTKRDSILQPSLTGDLSQDISTQVLRSNTDVRSLSLSTHIDRNPPAPTPHSGGDTRPSRRQTTQRNGLSAARQAASSRRPQDPHSATDDNVRRYRGELVDAELEQPPPEGASGSEGDERIEEEDLLDLPPKKELTARVLDIHSKFNQFGFDVQDVKFNRVLAFVESVQEKPEVNNIELFENIEKIRTRLRKLQGETGRLQHERIEHLFKTICSSSPLLRQLYLILQENNQAAPVQPSPVDAPPDVHEFANAPPPELVLDVSPPQRQQAHRKLNAPPSQPSTSMRRGHLKANGETKAVGLKSAPVSSTAKGNEWQSTSLPVGGSRQSTLSRSQSSRRHRSREADRPPFSNHASRSSSRHGLRNRDHDDGVDVSRPHPRRHTRSMSRTLPRGNGPQGGGGAPRGSYQSFHDFSATLKSEMRFLADSLTHERQSASEAENCIVQLMNLVINYQTQILENQNAEWDINEISTNFSLRIAELEETKYHLECHINEQEHQKKELEYAVYLAEQEAAKYAAQAAMREASLSARLRRKSHGGRSSASSSAHRRVSSSRASVRVAKRHGGHMPALSGLPLSLSEEKSAKPDSKPSLLREPSATNFADCSPPMRPELSVSASVPTLCPRRSSSAQSRNLNGSATPLLLSSATPTAPRTLLDLAPVRVDSSLSISHKPQSTSPNASPGESKNSSAHESKPALSLTQQQPVHHSTSNTSNALAQFTLASSAVSHSNSKNRLSSIIRPIASSLPPQQPMSQKQSSSPQPEQASASPCPAPLGTSDLWQRRAGGRHQLASASPILSDSNDPRQRRAGARHRHGRSAREVSHHHDNHWDTFEESAQGGHPTRRGGEREREGVVGMSAPRDRSRRRSSSRTRALDGGTTAFNMSHSHAPPLSTPDSARIRFSPSKVIELEKRLETLRVQNEDLEVGEAQLMRETRYLRQALDDAEKRCADQEAVVSQLEKSKSDHKTTVAALQQRVKTETERCQSLHQKFENLKFQFHYGDTEKDKTIDDLSKKLDRSDRAGRKEQQKTEELLRRCKRLEQRLDKVKNKRVASWIMEVDDPEVAANRRRRREEPVPMIQTHEIFYEEIPEVVA